MHNFGDVVRVLLNILLVLGLVSVNGFFVAAEFALVKIRETQLDMLVAKGNFRAKVARSIISNLNAYLSATQLGITMARRCPPRCMRRKATSRRKSSSRYKAGLV